MSADFYSFRYLVVGLKWIHSVVRKWKKELQTSGYSGTIQPHLDVLVFFFFWIN